MKYVLYGYRWLLLICCLLAAISNGFLMVGFSPIADNLSKIFDSPSILIQIHTMIFLMAYIPGNFIVIWILDKYGLKTCVSLIVVSLLIAFNFWNWNSYWVMGKIPNVYQQQFCIGNSRNMYCSYVLSLFLEHFIKIRFNMVWRLRSN